MLQALIDRQFFEEGGRLRRPPSSKNWVYCFLEISLVTGFAICCYSAKNRSRISRRDLGMNVSLTPELEQYVQDKVSSGVYYSASEVIREGLRLLLERDRLQEARLQQLRQEVQVGIDSGEPNALNLQNTKARARQRRQQKQPSP
jgi:antitoxin ParD1/3/4